MEGSAIIVAVFLASIISLVALALGFYTVRGLIQRSGEIAVEVAAGVFRTKFSAKIDADRDEPEVVEAPVGQERLEQLPQPPAIEAKPEGGGKT